MPATKFFSQTWEKKLLLVFYTLSQFLLKTKPIPRRSKNSRHFFRKFVKFFPSKNYQISSLKIHQIYSGPRPFLPKRPPIFILYLSIFIQLFFFHREIFPPASFLLFLFHPKIRKPTRAYKERPDIQGRLFSVVENVPIVCLVFVHGRGSRLLAAEAWTFCVQSKSGFGLDLRGFLWVRDMNMSFLG
jgi:hypothetical protein